MEEEQRATEQAVATMQAAEEEQKAESLASSGVEPIDKDALIVAVHKAMAAGEASTPTTHGMEVALRRQSELEAFARAAAVHVEAV